MGKKSYLWIYICCALAFSGGIFMGYMYEGNRDNAIAKVNEVTTPSSNEEIKVEKELFPATDNEEEILIQSIGYEIGEKDGYIALFELFDDESKKCIEITDMPINTLREDDRLLLTKGLNVDTKEEAIALLEDFTS